MIAYAFCPTCTDLSEVEVHECAVCEDRHVDLQCGRCGLRFTENPNKVTYVQEETEEEKKEVPRVLTPPSFPGL